ncbi:hypothetical protein ACU61A_15665 [Pseudonocardia sichuanensis]
MSRLARRGSLYVPSSGAAIVAPTFIGSIANEAHQGNDQPTTVPAPTGLASGDYQLVAVYAVSSSPTFPATDPAGWSLILDEAFDYPDTAVTSSGRIGLYESASAIGQFSVTMSSERVWNAVRMAWRGATRAAAPAFAFTPLGTAHATPPVDVAQANSVVALIGASELGDAGADWGWSGLGAAAHGVISLAGNAIEAATLAGGDLAVAAPADYVSATFTLPDTQRAAMISVLLHGAPA